MVLELGGNDPLVVMEDADPAKAAALAAAGSYKNSGQRCTAVKRILVHEKIAEDFVACLVKETKAWSYGDPLDPKVDMGTVINEQAAKLFEARVNDACAPTIVRASGVEAAPNRRCSSSPACARSGPSRSVTS